MNLKEFILKTIARLKAQGGSKAVVEYFKPYLKDVSIQKINAWIKNEKYPFEVADAVFANELEEHFEPQPNGAVAAEQEEVEVDLPPGTAFEEAAAPPGAIQTEDTGLVPPAFPAEYPSVAGQPSVAPRVSGKRASDIRVVTGAAPSMFGAPAQLPPTVDADEVARMAAILQALGFKLPGQPAVTAPARPPGKVVGAVPPGARTRVVGRNWNDPQQSASATKPPP